MTQDTSKDGTTINFHKDGALMGSLYSNGRFKMKAGRSASDVFEVIFENCSALLAERDTLAKQVEDTARVCAEQAERIQRLRNLPWRAEDIQRGLILFRTSSNAHGSVNFQARTEKIDSLPQSSKEELAGIMVNMALEYGQEDVLKKYVWKQLAETRNAALEEAKALCLSLISELTHYGPEPYEICAAHIDALKSEPATRQSVQEAAKALLDASGDWMPKRAKKAAVDAYHKATGGCSPVAMMAAWQAALTAIARGGK